MKIVDENEIIDKKMRVMELALSYYGQKIRKLIDNSDSIPNQMDDLKSDLIKESILAEQLRIELHDGGYYRKTEYNLKPIIEFGKERTIISNALDIYLRDLKKSKETIKDEIGTKPTRAESNTSSQAVFSF